MGKTPEQDFDDLIRHLGLPEQVRSKLDTLYRPIGDWVHRRSKRAEGPFILGVSGAQGSGKSTFCRVLSRWLHEAHGLKTATLSIDDLYLTRDERDQLGQSIHPLCAIRGVPGTHDIGLGHQVLDALTAASHDSVTHLPRFNKTMDDRCPPAEWEAIKGRPDVLLFEGWCVAARPPKPWAGPFNAREAREDPDGVWSAWSDLALREDYAAFFARLDALIMLKVPSMDTVRMGRWRQEERAWAAVAQAPDSAHPGLMTQAEVHEYVALFERLTTSILATMPAYADVIVEQDDNFDQVLKQLPR